MYSIGYVTVFLYLASVTFFLLGMFFPNFLILFTVLGAIFFIVPSIIIGVMMKIRINT